MAKKVNPRRRPATQADVAKAKNEAVAEAVRYVWAIFFTTMRDKHGWGVIRLRRLWDEVSALSDSVAKGYVSMADLCKTLEDEAGIKME